MSKKSIVVPSLDFKPARMPFGVVSQGGVDNFDRDGKEYSVSVELGKKQEKWLRGEVMEFWNENKPSGAGDEPANFANVVRDDGRAYFKTQVEFDGKPNIVKIVDGKKNPLDPEQFGSFSGDTTGRVSCTMGIYTSGRAAGVSLYLNAVQLITFEPYEGSDSTGGFGDDEGEAITDDHGFSGGETAKPKKKKKKKNKNKA